MNPENQTRRRVLYGIGGALTTLSGCGSDDTTTDDRPTNPPSTGSETPEIPSPADEVSPISQYQETFSTFPFTDVWVSGAAVVVDIAEEVDPEKIILFGPDGDRIWGKTIFPGEDTAHISLGWSYEPGVYTISADWDAEAEIEIEPSLEITGVELGANSEPWMPYSDWYDTSEEVTVKVKNSGNGPTGFKNLLLNGDVPNPTTQIAEDPAITGVANKLAGLRHVANPTILGDEETQFRSGSRPFSFEHGDTSCESMPTDGEFTVTLESAVEGASAQKTFAIEYGADDSSDGCSMQVSPSDS